jgi:hypothetical protein
MKKISRKQTRVNLRRRCAGIGGVVVVVAGVADADVAS